MCLLTAVEGGDGEVDVVCLGVVANCVTVRNEGPETHHTVCVRRHLKEQERGLIRDNVSKERTLDLHKYNGDTKTVALTVSQLCCPDIDTHYIRIWHMYCKITYNHQFYVQSMKCVSLLSITLDITFKMCKTKLQ